ncbi:MAG: hypothetical protein GX875_06040 [Propionibacterium sp.]|nr:hypothetical protein [Propionibacterium sp.]
MSEYFAVRRGSTSLLNKRVLDRRILYQALAILMTMLVLPPGAPMGYRDLMGRGLGEVATR